MKHLHAGLGDPPPTSSSPWAPRPRLPRHVRAHPRTGAADVHPIERVPPRPQAPRGASLNLQWLRRRSRAGCRGCLLHRRPSHPRPAGRRCLPPARGR
eukprot:2296037-Prymnesium_polylepis.1